MKQTADKAFKKPDLSTIHIHKHHAAILPVHDHIQRKANNHEKISEGPSIVHDVLRSPGLPLGKEVRIFFESRFGDDFSLGRVHTDASAAESARSVNAAAYTVGHDIVLGAGSSMPGTRTYNALLSHELTHVVQQKNSHSITGVPVHIGKATR